MSFQNLPVEIKYHTLTFLGEDFLAMQGILFLSRDLINYIKTYPEYKDNLHKQIARCCECGECVLGCESQEEWLCAECYVRFEYRDDFNGGSCCGIQTMKSFEISMAIDNHISLMQSRKRSGLYTKEELKTFKNTFVPEIDCSCCECGGKLKSDYCFFSTRDDDTRHILYLLCSGECSQKYRKH